MWTGGTVPFGYSVEDKKLLVNDAEARVVREAFALLLAHQQMAFVAQRITAATADGSLARSPRPPIRAVPPLYGGGLAHFSPLIPAHVR
jgi:hypothetical protein